MQEGGFCHCYVVRMFEPWWKFTRISYCCYYYIKSGITVIATIFSLIIGNLYSTHLHGTNPSEKKTMTLEFEEAIKALDEYIEILKQDLLSLSTDQKQDNNVTHIITVKRKLDRAVQERMKLNQIYCRPIVASP